MSNVSIPKPLETNFDLLIENLSNASLARDYKKLNFYLNKYFEADLSLFSELEQAWLNYFLGYYFVHFGKVENVINFQEKGKDHLTAAVDQFRKLNLSDEAVEAQITLGWSYFQMGEVENYEAFLLDALSHCRDQKSDAYYSVLVSLLIAYYKDQNLNEAFRIIDLLNTSISNCRNLRIKCQFYTNAGLVYRLKQQYHQAVRFYQQAIEISQVLNNKQFEGQTINNLAFAYKAAGELDLALIQIEKALKIFKELNNTGYTAEILDTKAQILFAGQDYEEALQTINQALFYFRKGESFLGLVEALWNKIEICYQLRRQADILESFRELSNVVERIDVQKQREYFAKFAKLVIFPFGDTFEEKMTTCEKAIIKPVYEESSGVVETSRRLGLRSHHKVSRFLDKNPEIDKKQTKTRSDKLPIRRITLKKQIIYADPIGSGIDFFQCSPAIAENYFGRSEELILLICQDAEVFDGDLLLVKALENFIATVVEENGKFYLLDEFGFSIQKNFRVFGKIIGFAPINNLNDDQIKFQKKTLKS